MEPAIGALIIAAFVVFAIKVAEYNDKHGD